jgi:Ca2+/Na+ antiporter
MKKLFILTAFIESVTGLILLISPSFLIFILLGVSPDSADGSLLGRIAGAALLSIGIACWLARKDEKSGAAKGIASAVLLYNIVAASLLSYAGLSSSQSKLSLWFVVLVHLLLAIWLIKIFIDGNHAKKQQG